MPDEIYNDDKISLNDKSSQKIFTGETVEGLQEVDSSPKIIEVNSSEYVEPDPWSENGGPNPKGKLNQGSENRNFFTRLKNWFIEHKKPILITLLGFFILGCLTVTAAGIWLIRRYNSIGDIKALATEISEGSIVFDRNKQELFRLSQDGQQREVIDLEKIPPEMQGAIIALEDENFYQNQVGIPWQNMIGAAIKCFFSGGENCRGGSGLSQQLIKNVTGDNSATYSRKINELLSAIKFNRQVGNTEKQRQDEVLRLYLNWVPFGRNTYGVAAAAKSYFGIDLNSEGLTIPQSCYLASMVQRPSTYAGAIELEIQNRENPEQKLPNPNWEVLQNRKDACIRKMYDVPLNNRGRTKFIQTEKEMRALQQEQVAFNKRPSVNLSYGHLRDYITEELTNTLGYTEGELSTKGYRIYTTFDKNAQDQVQNILTSTAETRIRQNGGNNGAAVVLDGPTGEIIAMVGSLDFNNPEISGQVNVATAARQPGSSYKPYVYASAFNNGFNPGTVLLDLPTDFGNYQPQNFSRTFSGVTSIRKSLADSLNIPAVKAAYLSQPSDGQPNATSAINAVMDFAEAAGVKHPFRNTCTVSAAIGACEISPLTHAVGINTLLQNGDYKPSKVFKEILVKDQVTNEMINDLEIKINQRGITAYTDQPGKISRPVAQEIANVMSDYGARSPGVWGNERRVLELDGWNGANQVAAKTGTTNDVKDTWTVGGSPFYTVVVWVGNTDGRPMNPRALSTQTAGTTWKDIMTFLHADKQPTGFSTDALTVTALDPLTGLLGEGKTEYLSQDQIARLKNIDKELSKNSYNPLQTSILQNRSPIIRRNVLINRIDGKLLPRAENGNVPGYPPQIAQEKPCLSVISEFPQSPNWFLPATKLSLPLPDGWISCPTEFSQFDPAASGPKIEVNFKQNSPLPSILRISAISQGSGATISNISFNLGGRLISEVNNSSVLEIDLDKLELSGIRDVVIKATDSLGLTTEMVIERVNFDNRESTSNGNNNNNGSSSSSVSSSSSSSSSVAQ